MIYDNGVGIADSLGDGENRGVYPVFFDVANNSHADIVMFIHSDLMIHEYGWDMRVIEMFRDNPKLGLIGFVGSDEINTNGGRGLGTRSNFSGKEEHSAPAEVHGARSNGECIVAQVDGCVMAMRRSALLEIPFRDDFPIHHFYDRLLSCEMLWREWQVGYIGVQCDHLGGQTACASEKYRTSSVAWLENRGHKLLDDNPDMTNYRIAESIFLHEWRDQRRFIPLKVMPSGTTVHASPPPRSPGPICGKFRDGTADSDIHEHMDTLHDLVLRVNARNVWELGVHLGNSTLAFLEACRKVGGILSSVDLMPCEVAHERVKKNRLEGRWRFTKANDLDIKITTPIDVLLIDSDHSYEHTAKELKKYAGMVMPRGFIALHDTKSFPGVWQAIEEFLAENLQFYLWAHHENNHGMGILRRRDA